MVFDQAKYFSREGFQSTYNADSVSQNYKHFPNSLKILLSESPVSIKMPIKKIVCIF